jgi:hypothetical protein
MSPETRLARRRPVDPQRGADPLDARPLPIVVDTPHYRVSTDVSRQAADDAAALLEHAWPLWCRRFGLDESYDAGPGRFSVRLYSGVDRFRREIRRESGFTGRCLGFVDFKGFRLFALSQHHEVYETRRILLHEGTHQFLYRLVGSLAAARLPRWYDEGCAHESEKHVLDDDGLEMFQHRGGWYSNQVEEASRFFAHGKLTIRSFLEANPMIPTDEVRLRACGWAVVHFLRCGAGPDIADGFARWEAALRAGSPWALAESASAIGGGTALTREMIRFLDEIE